ncbi:MAG: 16S rRNA (cytosine(967)-C(5))-methyltransferase RsmB, partial [Verrucomicrobia bacterium]|nr:16S rRNA (cytosine(967)-C(5))-methyltransferase RsmB [Verrucomicrobiota bacterium]
MTQRKPREIAIRVLLDRDRGRDYVENLLDAELAAAPPSPADRGLAQELTYGIVRWQAALDALIVRKTDGRPQKSVLQNLLRLGLYQLFWLDRIPPHAAVHETVELAKQLGCGPQAGFLNAVLRACERERGALRAQLNEWRTSQPHLGWSHPEWLVERWRARWGEEKLQQLLEWNNHPPRTFARVNTLKTDAGKLLERWRTENVEYDFARGDWIPESFAF